MSLDKLIEERRRIVQQLLMKGWTQQDIAKKLNVHYQTIHGDVKAINERYDKLVIENPNYLKKQLDKVFRFIDEFNLLKKEYWEAMRGLQPEEKRRMLDSIRQTMVEQAKVLKVLSTSSDKYLQQNFIHIDQVQQTIQPLIAHVIFILKRFVPEEKITEALEVLNNYSIDLEPKNKLM